MERQSEPSTTRVFGADHEWLTGLLAATRRAWDRGDAALAAHVFTKLDHRLRQHMRVEDELLFQTLEQRVGTPEAELAAGLRAEHDQLNVRLDRVSTLLASAAPAAGEELAELERVLCEHERREELLAFPACDRAVEPEVRSLAARELDRRLWGPSRGGGDR